MTRLLITLLAFALAFIPTATSANGNGNAANTLEALDVYVSPPLLGTPHAPLGSKGRLERAVQFAAGRGVTVKIAVLNTYPRHIHNPRAAADKLRNFLNFSGVLVLVAPDGLGVSSDLLSGSDIDAIIAGARSHCNPSYVRCAVMAANASIPRVKAEESRANRNVAIFWAVMLVIFGLIIGGLIWFARRQQGHIVALWGDSEDGPIAPAAAARSLPPERPGSE